MNIGLLLKTLKDRALIGVGFRVGRITDHAFDRCFLLQRELKALCINFLHLAVVQLCSATAAGSCCKSHACRKSKGYYLFEYILFHV